MLIFLFAVLQTKKDKRFTLNSGKTKITPRSCKRSETLFKSLLFWLAGEVSWLAVEVLSPC